LQAEDDEWWMGKKNNKTGLFPSNFVKENVPSEGKLVQLNWFLSSDLLTDCLGNVVLDMPNVKSIQMTVVYDLLYLKRI